MVVVAGNADSRVSRNNNNNNNNNNDLTIDDSDLNWLQPIVVALKVSKIVTVLLMERDQLYTVDCGTNANNTVYARRWNRPLDSLSFSPLVYYLANK